MARDDQCHIIAWIIDRTTTRMGMVVVCNNRWCKTRGWIETNIIEETSRVRIIKTTETILRLILVWIIRCQRLRCKTCSTCKLNSKLQWWTKVRCPLHQWHHQLKLSMLTRTTSRCTPRKSRKCSCLQNLNLKIQRAKRTWLETPFTSMLKRSLVTS